MGFQQRTSAHGRRLTTSEFSLDRSCQVDCLTIGTCKMDRIDRNFAEIEFLYRQYGAALLLFASAMTRERDRAQDVVHQVFLKFMEKGKLNRAEDKKAYLYACVRNAVLNERKLQDRHKPLQTDSAWFSPPDRDVTGEQNLRRALVALPEEQREVVILHLWGELTFLQIGDLLSVSSNTAASRYRYALEKLRDLMSAKENSCADSGR
jgi:RNA polymerase sigma-70 factor, ECF subfamily